MTPLADALEFACGPEATFGARERTGEIAQNSVAWRLSCHGLRASKIESASMASDGLTWGIPAEMVVALQDGFSSIISVKCSTNINDHKGA